MDIDDILADLDRDLGTRNEQDLRELTRLWVAERCAPELMQWPNSLIQRMSNRISKQIEVVEEKTTSLDPKSNFNVIVIQTELERIKFLMRSFLRARLAKIDAHPLYYIDASLSQSSRISQSERQYLQTHQALMTSHYASAFLSQFPSDLQSLDDKTGGISMIEIPDLDRAVFVRALTDIGTVQVPGTDVECDVNSGDIWILRWSVIKEWVERGKAELI